MLTRFAPIVGRILMSIIFLLSGLSKIPMFHSMAATLADKGVPSPSTALVVVITVELLGGLALLSGIYARSAALILFVYLIPVTAVMHAFWGQPADLSTMQMTQFLKNLAIMGGLLVLYTSAPESRFFKRKV